MGGTPTPHRTRMWPLPGGVNSGTTLSASRNKRQPIVFRRGQVGRFGGVVGIVGGDGLVGIEWRFLPDRMGTAGLCVVRSGLKLMFHFVAGNLEITAMPPQGDPGKIGK